MSKKNKPHQTRSQLNVQPILPVVKQEEVYIPSVNAEKYPEPPAPKNQYKILAYRNDYVRLQDEVVKHLNDGWKLCGGVSTSMNVSPYESVTIFAQAVFKE
jgi:hypothetical protein